VGALVEYQRTTRQPGAVIDRSYYAPTTTTVAAVTVVETPRGNDGRTGGFH
jgi:hypothetical protein